MKTSIRAVVLLLALLPLGTGRGESVQPSDYHAVVWPQALDHFHIVAEVATHLDLP